MVECIYSFLQMLCFAYQNFHYYTHIVYSYSIPINMYFNDMNNNHNIYSAKRYEMVSLYNNNDAIVCTVFNLIAINAMLFLAYLI